MYPHPHVDWIQRMFFPQLFNSFLADIPYIGREQKKNCCPFVTLCQSLTLLHQLIQTSKTIAGSSVGKTRKFLSGHWRVVHGTQILRRTKLDRGTLASDGDGSWNRHEYFIQMIYIHSCDPLSTINERETRLLVTDAPVEFKKLTGGSSRLWENYPPFKGNQWIIPRINNDKQNDHNM